MNTETIDNRYPESPIQQLAQLLFTEKEKPKWFEFKKWLALRARAKEERNVWKRAICEVGNTMMHEHGIVKELKFAGWEHVGNLIDHDKLMHDQDCLSVVAMVANREGISIMEALNTYEMFAQMDFVRGKECQGWDATCWARPKNME